tara:strand:+ start:19473 stop:19928 length:456 start_codon:yes stop_codon:yes gene_type:complete
MAFDVYTKGSVQEGMFVEPMYFVTLTFDSDISSSAFGVRDSVLEKALRVLGTRAVVTGIGPMYLDDAGTASKVDVILGTGQGFYVDDPATSLEIEGLQAEAVDGLDNAGNPISATFTATFAVFSGLDAATAADLVEGHDGEHRPATARHFK